MHFEIRFDGDLTLNEVCLILRQHGYHVHSDGAGRTWASRVPRFLAKEPTSNVLRLPGRARKVGR